jgi:hypothetical protein
MHAQSMRRSNPIQLGRRDALRFNVRAHVELFWQSSEGYRHEGVGLTRDVSEHGAYIWTDAIVQTGADVFIKICLQPAKNSRLTAHARVLRVDSPLDGAPLAGIAVFVVMFQMKPLGTTKPADTAKMVAV